MEDGILHTEIWTKVANTLTSEDFRCFDKMDPNEKVQFWYNLFQEKEILPSFAVEPLKSTEQALKFKSAGNKAFFQGQDAIAIKYCTKSIAVALPYSEELAIAFANRSAVFLRLKMYELCIQDADCALGISRLPDKFRKVLLDRRTSCFLKMGWKNEAQNSLTDSSVYNLIMDDEIQKGVRKIDKEVRKLIEACGDLGDPSDTEIVKEFHSAVVLSKNNRIPDPSGKIKLAYSTQMGRHVLASCDIKPCEFLSVEEPFAAALGPLNLLTHCSNCFRRNDCMIPCDNCSSAMFCNDWCRKECLERYHLVECPILGTLAGFSRSRNSSYLLAVRTLMIATGQGKRLIDLYSDSDFGKPFSPQLSSKRSNVDELFNSGDYKFIHLLEDHISERSCKLDFYFDAVAAVVILHLLKQSSFFDYAMESSSKSTMNYKLSNLEMYTGTLLLKYLLIIGCNSFPICETIETDWNMSSRDEVIGVGLYPFTSFINHSCDNNVSVIYSGCKIVLCTIQPIVAGQQLLLTYGCYFAHKSLEERRSSLRDKYFFKCECDACTFNWPLKEDLPSENPIYMPPKVDLEKLIVSSYRFGKIMFEVGNKRKAGHLEDLGEHLSLLHKSIKKPWDEYYWCRLVILECLMYKGNFYPSVLNETI